MKISIMDIVENINNENKQWNNNGIRIISIINEK